MTTQQLDRFSQTSAIFYMGKDNTAATQFIYDQTYKNYKIKQKFQKDPKFSYFNAVMQMKRKLSAKQQVYKNVFQKNIDSQEKSFNEGRKTFYISNINSQYNLFNQTPQTEVVRIEKLKRNSFKIMKQQPSMDALLNKNRQINQLSKTNRTGTFKKGRTSNLSLYQKPSSTKSDFSFQMTTKQRNNKSYVELEVKQKIPEQQRQKYVQPFNPKPRLDQIMSQYRRMNQHSHQAKTKKSSLPKQFVQKLYLTNKLFYSGGQSKKRSSLY